MTNFSCDIIILCQANVVPEKFKLTFDIRITPTTNIHEFENMIRG